jgi:heptose-I-phosphate ethanolaminephosphotransferase
MIDEIIRRFVDKNCCIVYLSDHGEEIYDLSDFMGHGNAEHSANLDYQIRVPLLIWTSRSYSRPEIVAKLPTLQHIPVTTDDVSQLLIDLAGIQIPSFEPSRIVVNENYNKNKKRIVLNSINYEYYKP